MFYSEIFKPTQINLTNDEILLNLKKVINRKSIVTFQEFYSVISDYPDSYLVELSKISGHITQKRFGKTVQMYAPLYLSNECQNICTYCGFSFENRIPRKTLNNEEILIEGEFLKNQGYEHILLVTGEANRTVGVDYLVNAVKLLRPLFSNISIEVQPLEIEEYAALKSVGVYAVLVYQETYDKEAYKVYHPKGKKSNFDYRLDTPDRIGNAGIHKIGIGALFGLSDWKGDALEVAKHLDYLRKKYWKSKFSISFPRLRPAEGYNPELLMNDKDLLKLIIAFRLFDENVELSISTRESQVFRNNIFKFGITSMSAGSKTEPGGYVINQENQELEQFEIDDKRSTKEIAEIVSSSGYQPVWKDWDNNAYV
jgi:2-iminoacetate synthase